MCKDRECMEKKFVVFESELDLQAHNLSEHAGRAVGRDARLVDISGFDIRQSYQQERRGDQEGGQEGEDADEDVTPMRNLLLSGLLSLCEGMKLRFSAKWPSTLRSLYRIERLVVSSPRHLPLRPPMHNQHLRRLAAVAGRQRLVLHLLRFQIRWKHSILLILQICPTKNERDLYVMDLSSNAQPTSWVTILRRWRISATRCRRTGKAFSRHRN